MLIRYDCKIWSKDSGEWRYSIDHITWTKLSWMSINDYNRIEPILEQLLVVEKREKKLKRILGDETNN